ncbi:Gluconate transport-inducing protein [Coemansia sp. RSA 2711]|nr:Gluconate transport-inducing protein [Coemansia sp. RSA 2711]KAJ1843487.1 Gluconate transport-inducing protein [Coemansia sp. RSA 2708]
MGDTRMETYYGFVSTSEDALALFEACRLGYKQRVPRRLSDGERAAIRSGSVFVWEEGESGMKRWTDGRSWSPSRVQGCFLTYHEWEGRRRAQRHPSFHTMHGFGLAGVGGVAVPMGIARYGHFIGGPTKAGATQVQYGFPKENGMLKKALSIRTTDGKRLHIIAYYSKEDHAQRRLLTPTTDANFPRLVVPPNLYPDMSPESMYGAGHAQQAEDEPRDQPSRGTRSPQRPSDAAAVDALSAGLHQARVQSQASRPAPELHALSAPASAHTRPSSNSFSGTPHRHSAPTPFALGLAASASAPASTALMPEPPMPEPLIAEPLTAEPHPLPLVSEATRMQPHQKRGGGGSRACLGLGGPLGLGVGHPRRPNVRSVTTAAVLEHAAPRMLSASQLPLLLSPVNPPLSAHPPALRAGSFSASHISLAGIRDAKEGPRRLPSISDAMRRDASISPPQCSPGGLGIFHARAGLLPSPLPTPRQSLPGFDAARGSPGRAPDSLALLASAADRAQGRGQRNASGHPYMRAWRRAPTTRSVSFKQSEDIRQLGVLDQSLKLK